MSSTCGRRSGKRLVQASALALACFTTTASASFLSGETLDTAADVLAWVVLVIVPVIGISLFWMVHVMPEKIAHRRHHPQTQAIHTLCLLSLVFGGLLWPIAWLWAYTRPVAYKLAYGTERSEEYFTEQGERARAGELSPEELAGLKAELDTMRARGALSAPLVRLREEIDVVSSPEARSASEPELRRA